MSHSLPVTESVLLSRKEVCASLTSESGGGQLFSFFQKKSWNCREDASARGSEDVPAFVFLEQSGTNFLIKK